MTVRDAVVEELVAQLGVEPEEATDEASITDDLGADSLDQLELLMACEERFGLEIPDEVGAEWLTVGQAVEWLEAHDAVAKAMSVDE